MPAGSEPEHAELGVDAGRLKRLLLVVDQFFKIPDEVRGVRRRLVIFKRKMTGDEGDVGRFVFFKAGKDGRKGR